MHMTKQPTRHIQPSRQAGALSQCEITPQMVQVALAVFRDGSYGLSGAQFSLYDLEQMLPVALARSLDLACGRTPTRPD